MINTIIIDDDYLVITYLINLFKKLSKFEINIVGTALNLEDGIELIKRKQPDIVFLDINLPGTSGLEIYKEFKSPNFKIIICTSYPQFAIEAFRKSADGYLLKPVDFILLQETIENVSRKLIEEQKQLQMEDNLNTLNAPDIDGESIILDLQNGFIIKNTRDIEYCYASQVYSYVVTYAQKEILVSKSLKELEEMLPANQFYRTHKSYLVNIYYIRKFVHASESYVVLKSGIKIPVSVRVSSEITKEIKRKFDS